MSTKMERFHALIARQAEEIEELKKHRHEAAMQGEIAYFDLVRQWLACFTPEELKTLRAIINGMLSKRKITPEQQAKMQAGRKRKVI